MLVTRFHDYGAAHRALCELIQFGVAPNDVSIIAGDRRDYIEPVRRGMTLLAVIAEPMQRRRVAEIVEAHAPADIEERLSARAAAEAPR
jgi:hypothetical protein